MELWIRSQDKMLLRKPEQLFIYEGNEVWFIGESLLIDYGKYKTKERALEVLDEIQSILKPAIKALTPLIESKEDYKNHCMKTELVGYETTYDIVALPTYVYEMPSK